MRPLESHFFKTTEEFLDQLDTTVFVNECILIKGAESSDLKEWPND